jgi:hypothetical protein
MGIGSLQNLYISSFSHVKIFVKKIIQIIPKNLEVDIEANIFYED